MKIDVLVSSLKGGGAERVAVNLADSWAEAGHDVRLLIQTGLDAVEYRPSARVRIESFATRNRLLRALRLRRMLAVRRADAVIAVQGNMAIVAALVGIGLGLNIIGSEHNIPGRAIWGRGWAALRPFAYRRLSCITVLTGPSRDALSILCPGVPIHVIPNALRLPLAENPPQLAPESVVPPNAVVLLAAGRLVPAKGFDRMIAAFAHLVPAVPSARLVILGEGEMRAALERQVQELGLSGRVLLPGRAGNMAQWYCRAELFLMTSRWEGLPMVLLEAMGHGLPAVTTDFQDGPRDIIRHDIDGLILSDDLPDRDPAAWAATVSALLTDSPTLDAMASRASEVLDRFSEARVMALWDEALEQR